MVKRDIVVEQVSDPAELLLRAQSLTRTHRVANNLALEAQVWVPRGEGWQGIDVAPPK